MMISDRVSLALAGMAARVVTPKSPVFPDESKAEFQIGDRVMGKPLFNSSPDWGVVRVADTAWEEDLQPLEVEGTQLLDSQLKLT